MSEPQPFPDPFEFLKRMWGPMALPMSGIAAPLLDMKDLEKHIADLKSVEQWLNMNLSVLRMSIQGLELQRATLAAFQSMQSQPATPSAGGKDSPPQPNAAGSAAELWWNLFQQAQGTSPPKGEKKQK
jgi:hypothetical protein